MPEQIKAYRLICKNTNEAVFDAAFCKYYPDLVFCALFADYPAVETRVLVCRRVKAGDRQYGQRLCSLVSHNAQATETVIGDYIVVCEVSSEKAATEKVEAAIKGSNLLRNLLNSNKH